MDFSLPFRQIHLDFHTSPFIPEVGRKFDAQEFAETFAAAHVTSVTLFAKCHHGHLYYQTDHPAAHPTMSGSLLEGQIEALHRKGIRAPIYLSVQCDEFAANTHPEWIAMNPDGTRVGRQPGSADYFNWQILDMASPYLDYLCEQTVEVMKKFRPVDGLFFDMCWDQPSVSPWARERMKAWALDPESAKDRDLYARRLTHHYMERITTLVDKFQKNVPLWFNSRPLLCLKDEKQYLRHIEVEALPSGQWGYTYFPTQIRFVRPLAMPTIGMTGRFHKSWADFGGLRTAASLTYDCAQALAHGAACSVGDQLHPSGKIDRGVYEVIGEVFSHVEKCEPWCRDTKAVKEIAVLYQTDTVPEKAPVVYEGVYRCLTPLGYQYSFLTPDDAWEEYSAVILPETVALTEELRARLKAYPGAVLREVTEGEASPYTVTYLRFEPEARGNLANIDHVFYERGVRLKPGAGDYVVAHVVEPYFERTAEHFCSHAQTPGILDASPYAAAIIRGREALFALPVFRAGATHGNLACRQLLSATLQRLLPEPTLKLEAPSYVEAVVNEQDNRVIVHLLSYVPQKKTPTMEMVEEAMPALNLRVSIKTKRPVASVTRQPSGQEIPFQREGDYVAAALGGMAGHEMVAFEFHA